MRFVDFGNTAKVESLDVPVSTEGEGDYLKFSIPKNMKQKVNFMIRFLGTVNADEIYHVENCFGMPAFAFKARMTQITEDLKKLIGDVIESQEETEIKFGKFDGKECEIRICAWDRLHPELLEMPKKIFQNLPITLETYVIYVDKENGKLFVRFTEDDEMNQMIDARVETAELIPVTNVEQGK